MLREASCDLTIEEWYDQGVFDKKDTMGLLSLLNQVRSDIRYGRFADAESIVKELQDTCKSRLWPGSLTAHLPSVTMDFPNLLCPEAKNEEHHVARFFWNLFK